MPYIEKAKHFSEKWLRKCEISKERISFIVNNKAQPAKNTALILRKKCPYSEFFWSVFSRIRTEYGDLLCKCPYSVQMWENTDQKNSKYGYFLRSFHKTYKPNVPVKLQLDFNHCNRTLLTRVNL